MPETTNEEVKLVQLTLTPYELADLHNLYLLGLLCLRTNLGIEGAREVHDKLLSGIIIAGPQSENTKDIAERLIKLSLGTGLTDMFKTK